MEEWYDFDAAALISLKLEEGGGREELLALSWQTRGNIDELIIIDSLSAVVGLRHILLAQVPQLLEVFLLEHFAGLVLQGPGPRFLPHSVEEGIFALLGLLEEELRNGSVRWIILLCKSSLFLKQALELFIGILVVVRWRLVRLVLVILLLLLDPIHAFQN